MANLLDKASILLTPTAYDNGSMLSIKPTNGDGDFTFSRNSAATRVNAQGLVENVQILSSNLVQNGSFSEIGAEEVSNGSFSEQGAELVTNGDFSNGSTDWTLGTGWSIGNDKAINDGTVNQGILQENIFTIGKIYKITFDVDVTSGTLSSRIRFNGGGSTTISNISASGSYTFYQEADRNGLQYIILSDNTATSSITNISVKEVGQDWTFVGEAELIEQGARIYSSSGGQSYIKQDALTNTKSYKISYDIVDSTQGALKLINVNGVSDYSIPSTVGSHIVYFTANTNTLFIYRSGVTDITITNISVKEVGQNWTFGDGFTPDEVNSKATCDGTQSAATNLTQTISTNIQNKLVRVSFTLDYTAGVLLGSLSGTGAVDFNNITSSGTYTAEMTSNEVSPPLILQGDTNFIGSITNIVLLEVTNDTNLPRINYEGFSYQDSLGSEEIVNGDFENGIANWNFTNASGTNGWRISNSKAICDTIGVANGRNLNSSTSLVSGKSYKVTLDILQSEDEISIIVGSTTISNAFPIGTTLGATYIINSSQHSGGIFSLYAGTSDLQEIDNVSVKEYFGQEVVPDSGCGSWLLEDESTNLITYSEDLSDTSWSKINSGTASAPSVTANYGISPDGTQNASRVIFDLNGGTTSSDYSQIQNFISSIIGNDYTPSVYMKSNDSNSYNVTFTNVNGTKNVVSVTPQWQRFDVPYPATTTSGSIRIRTRGSEGSSDVTDVLIWGAQLEQQSYATSYIPTSGASSTRLRDLATDSGNSTLINSTEGVLYFEGSFSKNTSNQQLTLNNGTTSERIVLEVRNNGQLLRFNVRSSDTNSVEIDQSINTDTYYKLGLLWSGSIAKFYLNGSLIGSDSSVTYPIGLDSMSFNSGTNSFPFYGKTKALAVYKEALTDAELTLLTTI